MDIAEDAHPIRRQTLEDIEQQSTKLAAMLGLIRESIVAPDARKQPPTLTAAALADVCQVDKSKISYRITRGDLPVGEMTGNRREFSLTDVRVWTKDLRAGKLRPELAAAVTITCASLKGGVAKTTTSVALAQSLAMRGHDVLLIDLDPQGSATSLFGVLPDADVSPEQTALPLLSGRENDISYAIQPSYWPGVDLVCAAPLLFEAEFELPSRQAQDPGFEFWRVLDEGLDAVRDRYSVILIDTPPSLSFTTMSALLAADGVLIPLPPSAMDFAASAHFWHLFSDLCNGMLKSRGQSKAFEFIDVLLSRVESNDATSNVIRQWILEGYGDKVLPVEIPKTSVAQLATAEFGTVYDVPRSAMNGKTYDRARDAFDRLTDIVEQQIQGVWKLHLKQLQKQK